MQIHWPLVISTVCQRAGLGLFVCVFAVRLLDGSVAAEASSAALSMQVTAWITLALLAVGGFASIFHLQRPTRFFNAFSNFKSHLTQEAFITPFLGAALLVCALDGILYHLDSAAFAVQAVTAVLALAFLVCTGLAYQMGSRPAWNTPFILALFLLTAAEAGMAGAVFSWAALDGTPSAASVVAALVCFAACVACQVAYVARMRHVGYGVDVDAMAAPYRGAFLTWAVFGAAVPAVCLVALFVMSNALVAGLAWASCVIGVGAWTVLFFKGAHKVKMFPMYPVDLNLDM